MKTTCFFFVLSFFICGLLWAKEPSLTQRVEFGKVDNLIRLIEKARDAGLNDDEIKKLKLDLETGGAISILAYIEKFKRKQREKDQKLKDFLSKRFLTVGDIFNEMVEMEPKQLESLREKLISGN